MEHSKNKVIQQILTHINNGANLNVDKFLSTREVLKDVRHQKKTRVIEELTTQSLVVKSILEHAIPWGKTIWHKAHDNLQKNIYSFCL